MVDFQNVGSTSLGEPPRTNGFANVYLAGDGRTPGTGDADCKLSGFEFHLLSAHFQPLPSHV